MSRVRTSLASLVFVLSLPLWIASCSGDTEGEPDAPQATAAPANQESEQGSGESPTAPRGAVEFASADATADVRDGKFKLQVRNGSYLSKVLPGMYRERCIEGDSAPQECDFLHSLLIVEITMALEEIERSRDQRGADEALAALQLDEEPSVLIAAMRVLGQFPDTPGIADRVLPLMLESPWTRVQETAARLLASNPDQELAAIGALWGGNHSQLYAESEYSEYPDFSSQYADMEFPDYPDAEWFSPADSDRSVGWWTTDDATTVSDWLSKELGTEPLTYQQWAERLSAESMAAMNSIDPVQQAEVERLMAEFTKTQNMALLEQMQKLQEEMYAPVQQAGKVSEMGVGSVAPPSTANAFETVRYFIAEEQDGHIARMVAIYPLPGLRRTVIQEAWNLLDYPSAWPSVETPES